MKLVNMKLPKRSEKELATAAAPSDVDQPRYPWGLSLNLEDESLQKLGIDALPEVGVTLSLTANVTVTSVSARDDQDGGKRRSISLQITDMALETPAKKNDGRSAEILFGQE